MNCQYGVHDAIMSQGGIPNHGFTHWWTMFNPRQLLVHAQLLKAIVNLGSYSWTSREYVLGAFQQYLRNQNLFCFLGHRLRQARAPHEQQQFSSRRTMLLRTAFFPRLGRGNWASCSEVLIEDVNGRDIHGMLLALKR